MKKLFEFMIFGGLTGFIIIRIFFYDYKAIMFSFAILALVGFVGRKLTNSKKNNNKTYN